MAIERNKANFIRCRRRRKENPNSVTEWHNADELVRVILDCGGKRSATPLFRRSESGVALRLPPQSKSVHWHSLIVSAHAVHPSLIPPGQTFSNRRHECPRTISVIARSSCKTIRDSLRRLLQYKGFPF